jgi:hypothetical protein
LKKITLLFVVLILSILMFSCDNDQKDPNLEGDYTKINREIDGLLLEEQYRSFKLFWETSNSDSSSRGFGMARDRYPGASGVASIAAVGYALSAIPIGVENGWITYDEGYERALGTMDTLLGMTRYSGFYFHFVSMHTTERVWDSEISVIDTALLVAGALFAGQYFGGEINHKAKEIYDGVDWSFYINPISNRFFMSYDPDTNRHSGAWDGFAEQLIMYVLAAGSNTYPQGNTSYRVLKTDMQMRFGPYISQNNSELNVDPFYFTFGGELFTHQFSHAYVDFRNILDRDGLDFHENARRATLAAYHFAIDVSSKYRSLHASSWGLSAGDGPNGYRAYGQPPANHFRNDGTVTPYAAIASVIHLEEASLRALYHYKTFQALWGPYGFRASYNLGLHEGYFDSELEGKVPYFSPDVIGIDKGITMLMIENYRSDFIWQVFMDIPEIQRGLNILGFEEK